MGKKYNFITIGSATLDNFIESDKSIIASYAGKEGEMEFMCFPYGSKVEIDDFSIKKEGNFIVLSATNASGDTETLKIALRSGS